MNTAHARLTLRRLGIEAYKETVVYVRTDSPICTSEGFEARTRVKVTMADRHIIATLNVITSDLLQPGEAGLSEYAWKLLHANVGETISISHILPVTSLGYVRKKIYGKSLKATELNDIVKDITAGYYADVHIAAFLTACAGKRLKQHEIIALTESMIAIGDRIAWPEKLVVDKHCVGGLPGNRTTLIVVPIIAAFGLMIPKTSSRAITSSAGTADTMEVLAPVDLNFAKMQAVVNKEKGCIIWGGSVSLSPADDILIAVERALNLDSSGQLVASILSKKVAAGSNHILIDIPIGSTAKVRDLKEARYLRKILQAVGKKLGVKIRVLFSDGTQPIGNGIGPSLEARDVLKVLENAPSAPKDLRDHSLTLAGMLLEFSPKVRKGCGKKLAAAILKNGQALQKFKDICEAQGGMRTIPKARYTKPYIAKKSGKVIAIDNRYIARVAKLAGAPTSKAAGVDLHVHVGDPVKQAQALFTVHSESEGELEYAFEFLRLGVDVVTIG